MNSRILRIFVSSVSLEATAMRKAKPKTALGEILFRYSTNPSCRTIPPSCREEPYLRSVHSKSASETEDDDAGKVIIEQKKIDSFFIITTVRHCGRLGCMLRTKIAGPRKMRVCSEMRTPQQRVVKRVCHSLQKGFPRRIRGQGVYECGSHCLLRTRFHISAAASFDQHDRISGQ